MPCRCKNGHGRDEPDEHDEKQMVIIIIGISLRYSKMDDQRY
jgi:hypothetical protein